MSAPATSRRPSWSGSGRSTATRYERAAAFADACRLNALYMVQRAGSGHLGTTFSSLDIVCLAPPRGDAGRRPLLLLEGPRRARPLRCARRRSAGSTSSSSTALRRLNGLPGHPDVAATPEVVTSTGSLGMGVSKARGFVLADRLAGRSGRVYVLTGDGELQEGQFWESLQPTANRGLHEITVIVDRNRVQSDTWVDAGQRPRRPRGRRRARSAGRSPAATATTPQSLARRHSSAGGRRSGRRSSSRDTKKGGGVSFMEPRDAPAARRTRRCTTTTSARRRRSEYAQAVEEVRRAPGRAARAARRSARRARGGGAARASAARPSTASGSSRLRRGAGRGGGARAAAGRPRRRPASSTAGSIDVPRALPRALLRVRHRRAGHGLAGRGDGARRAPAGRPLLRLLPLHAPERADLQQRDRGDEGHLRRLARRPRARAAPATRTSRCATSRRSARCPAWR